MPSGNRIALHHLALGGSINRTNGAYPVWVPGQSAPELPIDKLIGDSLASSSQTPLGALLARFYSKFPTKVISLVESYELTEVSMNELGEYLQLLRIEAPHDHVLISVGSYRQPNVVEFLRTKIWNPMERTIRDDGSPAMVSYFQPYLPGLTAALVSTHRDAGDSGFEEELCANLLTAVGNLVDHPGEATSVHAL